MSFTLLHDRDEIERFFRTDVGLHIYSLGDLDDFFWSYTTWFAHRTKGEISAIALLYAGMAVPTLLALNTDVEPMADLVSSIRELLPLRFYAHLSPGLASVLEPTHQLHAHGLHCKMVLSADAAARLRAASPAGGTVRLGTGDLTAVLAFYEEAYPGNWVDPRMLETGQYVGIREEGRLVSVAGIHVYSPRYRVAALGNIATLPTRRGRGYGSCATAELCRVLVNEGLDVGLNVGAQNEAAIACYRKIGFRTVAHYEEYEIERSTTSHASRPNPYS